MEIIKTHYKISKPVNKYKEIEQEAKEMKRFIVCGEFKGYYNKAFAIAHAQVSETPMSFFVVSPDVVNEEMFEDQIIINPEILEANNEASNAIEYEEASMSFPFRQPKRLNRYDKIKVRYQIKKMFGLKHIVREIEGIASQIFQAMYDHTQGKNIFFTTETPVRWWKLIGTPKTRGGNSLDN